MQIQPTAGTLRLREGKGDQFDCLQKTMEQWERDLKINPYTAPIGTSPRNAALYAWPVGTGKTPGALRLIYAWTKRLEELGDPRCSYPSLVVCDKPTKRQWLDYVPKWVPEWGSGEVLVIDGSKTDVEMQFSVFDICKHVKLLVVNYDKLVDYLPEFLKRGPYLVAVLDEIRRIKNADTQRNQAADALDVHYRVGLDGTPLTTWPDSLHGILNWLNPGARRSRLVDGDPARPDKDCYYRTEARFGGFLGLYQKTGCEKCTFFMGSPLKGTCAYSGNEIAGQEPYRKFYHLYSPEWGNHDNFRAKYCKLECPSCGAVKQETGWMGGKANCAHRWAKVSGGINTESLKSRLLEKTGLMFSIDRRSIKGFPVVTPRRVDCVLTAKQSKFYRECERGLIQYLEGDTNYHKDMPNVLSQISWLRSCATLPPAVVIEKMKGTANIPEWLEDVKIPPDLDGGKQLWVQQFMEDYVAPGDKVILFSEWTSCTFDLVRRLENLLRPKGQYVTHIHGGLKDSVREDAKKDFNSDPRCTTIVCSPAGNAGLNLHEAFLNRGGEGTLWVLHVDTGWTATDIEQRTGRAQRVGFDGAAIVANFLIAVLDDGGGTIDSRMADRVMARASISDLVTGTNLNSLLKFVSLSDVLQLLGR